ncbi:hypothetical protein HJFPF1_01707 [Paramyrothecium foliicola]|nr:hypothetical protein HJFPF1_01707 [Paramyrothecium foliicola]
MDRSRRSVSRRRPLGTSASPQSASEASFDYRASVSPIMAHATNTPQTAPQARRASGKSLQTAFTFSTPATNRSVNLRKRSKTTDNYDMLDDDEDDDGPKKGGHSLRKRARVDYKIEHIDDEVVVPNSSSASRTKKRKPDIYDPEHFYGSGPKRRGASVGADNQGTRRRNPARKSTETRLYREEHVDDENDVQDTIEVGVSFSDLEDSDLDGSGHTTPSPDQSHKARQTSSTPKPPEPKSIAKSQAEPGPSAPQVSSALGIFSEQIAHSPEHVDSKEDAPATSVGVVAETRAKSPVQESKVVEHQTSEQPALPTQITAVGDDTRPTEAQVTAPSENAFRELLEPQTETAAGGSLTRSPLPVEVLPTKELPVKEETIELPRSTVDTPVAPPASTGEALTSFKETSTKQPEASAAEEPEAPTHEGSSPSAIKEVEEAAIAKLEAPVVKEPEASAVSEPELSTITEPEVPTVTEPKSSNITEPESSSIAETRAPTITESDTPAITEPDAAVIKDQEAAASEQEKPEAKQQEVIEAKEPEEPEASVVNRLEGSVVPEPAETVIKKEPPAILPQSITDTAAQATISEETPSEADPVPTVPSLPESTKPIHVDNPPAIETTGEAIEIASEDVPGVGEKHAAVPSDAISHSPKAPSEIVDEAINETISKSAEEVPVESADIVHPTATDEGSPMILDDALPQTTDTSLDVVDNEIPNEVSTEPIGDVAVKAVDKSEAPLNSDLLLQSDATPIVTETVIKEQPLIAPSEAPSEKKIVEADVPMGEPVVEVKESPKPPMPQSKWLKPQPTPSGKWAHLTPYLEGEFSTYPEKRARSDDDGPSEDQTPEEKEVDKEAADMEPMVEDNDDGPDVTVPEAPTPALNTPTRGSPVPDSADPTSFNSPAPAIEEADDAEVSESQDPADAKRYFKYRKLRDAEEYIAAIENYEDMSTAELYETLEAINVSMIQWQKEWTGLSKVVDDYENSLRRRLADSKYESRTRNLHQHGINYEEPDFALKGYRAKERETISETRFLQGQDRIMAATYGFEYDPHPSKIGRQNPETQQVGIMTRGRSLRNQPRQTVKASEADEVTSKRQRKPVQLYDPAMQDISRSSTPVPTRGRRRRNLNGEAEDAQQNITSSFDGEIQSDGDEAAPRRRKRAARQKQIIPSIIEDMASFQDNTGQPESTRPGRRARAKQTMDTYSFHDFDDEPQSELKQPKRHLLTLKIPKGKNFSEPSSAITDNGDSRPSTASSDSTSHTAESSYSFRPKRQKRFRDDPDESESANQAPPKKRGKRSSHIIAGEDMTPAPGFYTPEPAQMPSNRKVQKIKVVRANPESRNGTPSSQPPNDDGDEPRKDYKSMTKSEKMSASMKSRWANGNMAGAVEKRKATLAAKKAAQAAAEQRVGPIAPKPKTKPTKKDAPTQIQAPEMSQELPGMGMPYPGN